MKTEIRIVAGSLRGRKLSCRVTPDLRPTPQRVREAFFSILGNAVPNRLFVDVFAGTGVVGLEALSRGAKMTYFIERDPALANDINSHLRKFDLLDRSRLYRTDSYRWVASWRAPEEPANVFLSPPFPDLHHRPEVLLGAVKQLQEILAPDSVIVLQSERGSPLDDAAELASWERRLYGRNVLLLWQRELPDAAEPS
jgi:16S rRNA (guanine(966)-N(2))-methyltransferase RsmD